MENFGKGLTFHGSWMQMLHGNEGNGPGTFNSGKNAKEMVSKWTVRVLKYQSHVIFP